MSPEIQVYETINHRINIPLCATPVISKTSTVWQLQQQQLQWLHVTGLQGSSTFADEALCHHYISCVHLIFVTALRLRFHNKDYT